MRQYIASAALLAALTAAQAGDQLLTGTNDEKDSTIKGEWNETITDADRDNYKVEDVTEYNDMTDLEKRIAQDELEDEIGFVEPWMDGASRPLCSIAGFENQVDAQGPSDQCCRVYEYSLYKGRFRDFCLQTKLEECNAQIHRQIALDDYGWHNEMNSWKCGASVGMNLCAYPEDLMANKGMVHHATGNEATRQEYCNSGHHFNGAMGDWSDKVDQIEIFALAPPCDCSKDPDPLCHRHHCHTTVYSDLNCQGASKLIRSDILIRPKLTSYYASPATKEEVIKGSWDHYNGQSWPAHFGTGLNSSFTIDGGCAVEIFNQVDFQSESWTFRVEPRSNTFCKDAEFHHELNGWKWASEYGGTIQEGFTDASTSNYFGFHAWQVREIYFPHDWQGKNRAENKNRNTNFKN